LRKFSDDINLNHFTLNSCVKSLFVVVPWLQHCIGL